MRFQFRRFQFQSEAGLAALVHPLNPVPRTAILAAGFEETRLIRGFPSGWSQEAERFRPTALAGTFQALRPLTIRGDEIALRHAVIVFHYGLDIRLLDSERDLLWKAFGVPIFEQILDADNRLLAMECEAHEGLHLMVDRACEEMDRAPCPCGNPRPRLAEPRPVRRMAALVS